MKFADGPVGTPANDAPDSTGGLKTACEQALSSFASVVARELRRVGYTSRQAEAAATLIVSANQGAILVARTAKNGSLIETALRALAALGAGGHQAASRKADEHPQTAPPLPLRWQGVLADHRLAVIGQCV